LRRELFAASIIVGAIVACTPEKPYTATFTFTANPLPPVPGQLVQFSFDANKVGLVELFQGTELVGVVVNPSEFLDDIYRFPAKNALTPRAVAYGVNGAVIEVEATRGFTPPKPVDAGPVDAPTTPTVPTESCSNSTEVTPDVDAGTGCATFGAVLVNVRIHNQRPTPLWIYRDQWSPPTPPCTFQPAGIVDPGQFLDFPTIDNGVIQFVESTTAQPFRHVAVHQAPTSCLLVAK
jgi:hypothetical protein